ncbi:MAG: hypothetical protein WCF36_16385 [Candidatus Nanopelagicales bacterium]
MRTPLHELTSDQQRQLAELLVRWLPGQRWFAGKGNTVTDVRIGAIGSVPCDRLVLEVIVGVQLDGSVWQTYQVPLSLHTDPHPELLPIGQLDSRWWTYDALTDPAAVHALLHAADSRAQIDPELTHQLDASGGEHLVPILQAVADPERLVDLPVRPLGAEQSNTSVILGDVAFAKFFRQLVPGINPDIEVHAALTVAQCPHISQILGWSNAGWRDPEDGRWVTGHTAMVQQLLSPAVEGRDLALERVARAESFAREAHDLGHATGVVHRDLRTVLPTHELSAQEVAELADRLDWRLDQAVAVVADLAEMAPALHERIDSVRGLARPITVQRVHGDLHLQQVMRAGDGWRLLDFEGEPGSSVSARTALDHPLRDVAGMLRSFAYAAAQGGADRKPDEVSAWLRECEEAFLAGYATAGAGAGRAGGAGVAHAGHAGHGGHGLLDQAHRTILDAYLVDKAAYEAAYEQRNRPDWLPIPMAALRALAG